MTTVQEKELAMNGPCVDPDLVARICLDAATGSGHSVVVDVVHDPLDGSTWIRMSTPAGAREAFTGLNAFGIGGHDLDDGRLHVTGWDVRLLHWRLGALLAAVDALTTGWDATADMACYHHDRRVTGGVDADPADILADVEDALRACRPIPNRAPRIDDVDSLHQLISAADDAYQQLIARHVTYAELVLTDHMGAGLLQAGAA